MSPGDWARFVRGTRAAGGRRAAEVRALVPRLFEKRDGNLREALRDLYDHDAGVEA
jgi:hypothetical protein